MRCQFKVEHNDQVLLQAGFYDVQPGTNAD